MTPIMTIVLFNLAFFVHNIYYVKLMEKVFHDKKDKAEVFLSCLFSCAVGSGLLLFIGSMSALGYGIMLAVYSIHIFFVYRKAPVASKMLCVLVFTLQIMTMRALVSSVASLVTGRSILSLSEDPVYFWLILLFTALLSLLLTLCLLHIVPERQLQVINQKIQQMYFVIAISCCANGYMILNGMVYITEISYSLLPWHQILTALLWLGTVYISMFFLLGFEALRADKTKLEHKLTQESLYRHTLQKEPESILEINCSRDQLMFIIRGKTSAPPTHKGSYSDYVLPRICETVHPEDLALFTDHSQIAYMLEAFQSGNHKYSYLYRLKPDYGDGSYRWFRSDISLRQTEANGDIIAVNTMLDVHEEKLQELILRSKAELDPLLGVYNKASSEQLITEHLTSQQTGMFYLIDLDNFKEINDNMGHLYGDEVLKEIGYKLSQNFRQEDLIGRIGGDEFIVFIRNSAPPSEIKKKAERLCDAIQKTYRGKNGVEITVSCSIGIALVPEHGIDYKSLYTASDLAMYTSKRKGKNTYTIYDKKMLSMPKEPIAR